MHDHVIMTKIPRQMFKLNFTSEVNLLITNLNFATWKLQVEHPSVSFELRRVLIPTCLALMLNAAYEGSEKSCDRTRTNRVAHRSCSSQCCPIHL